jgi:hypothetical protein
LEARKGKWVEELPLVLWADRTTPKTSTGQSPFSLVYGCEAVLSAEVVVPTARTMVSSAEVNAEQLAADLDLVEELRDAAKIRLASYQQTISKYYNKDVRARIFRVGDMVLREVFPNTKEKGAGKLAASWEGPYLIDSVAGNGAYRLTSLDGEMIENPWNARHLKIYHM